MDIYFSIFTLIQLFFPVFVTLLVLFFGIKFIKNFEKRAQAKLEIEKQNNLNNQKQLDELMKKVNNIENILTKIN